MATIADAVVVGGGVMGCSILYNLADRGVTGSVLLEMNSLASGSTDKSQAILRTHYSNEVTARMAWESLRWFRDFEEIVGSPVGFTCTGYVIIVSDEDRQSLEQNVAMMRGIGVDTQIVSPREVKNIAPMFTVREDEAFAYEPQSGYADPYSVTTGYANRARSLGATIRVETPVTGIEVSGGRVTAVVTPDDKIATSTVVVAAGPWSGQLLKGIGVDLPLRPLRHQLIMLRRPEDRVPDHPIIADVVNGYSARPDPGHLTIIGVGEDEFVAPEGYDQGVDMPMVEEAFTSIARRIPAMSGAWFRGGWAGLFTVTPDWHPILDKVEGIDGLYCAVGFSGHGYKLSPMVGVTMAELITQGRSTSIDISMLDLARFRENRQLGSRYRLNVLA